MINSTRSEKVQSIFHKLQGVSAGHFDLHVIEAVRSIFVFARNHRRACGLSKLQVIKK